MSRARRARAGPDKSDRWLVSYADFVTLLFAVFTTLYAISAVDAKRAEQLVRAIEESFASHPRAAGMPGEAALPDSSQEAAFNEAALRERAHALQREYASVGGIEVRESTAGLVLTLADEFFFTRGGDALDPGSSKALEEISRMLQDVPNHVRVEGHSDNRPIATPQFPTNWHLSSARAAAIVRALERSGVPSHRLSVAGFAAQRPLVSNETAEGRRINRRVDVVILRTGETPSS